MGRNSTNVGDQDQQGKKIAMSTANAMHLLRSIGKEGVAWLFLIAESNGNHELLTVASSFSSCSLTQTQEKKSICSKNPWWRNLRFQSKTSSRLRKQRVQWFVSPLPGLGLVVGTGRVVFRSDW